MIMCLMTYTLKKWRFGRLFPFSNRVILRFQPLIFQGVCLNMIWQKSSLPLLEQQELQVYAPDMPFKMRKKNKPQQHNHLGQIMKHLGKSTENHGTSSKMLWKNHRLIDHSSRKRGRVITTSIILYVHFATKEKKTHKAFCYTKMDLPQIFQTNIMTGQPTRS